MSIKLMSAVFENSKTTGTARLIMLALADSCNDQGECYPSIDSIAQKAAVSPRTCRIYLHALEKKGVLKISKRVVEGRQTSNLYRMFATAIGNDELTKADLDACRPESDLKQENAAPYQSIDTPASPISPLIPGGSKPIDSHPPLSPLIDEPSLRTVNEPKECPGAKNAPAAPAAPAPETHHVSLVAFREVRGRWPARECWQQIIETVGDAPAALTLWRDVLTAWSAAGYSPTRIDGPLDWYRAGGAPGRKPAQQQRPTSSQRAHSARTAAHASYNDYWDAKMQARGLPLVEAPRVPQPSPDSPWYDQTAQEAVTA